MLPWKYAVFYKTPNYQLLQFANYPAGIYLFKVEIPEQ